MGWVLFIGVVVVAIIIFLCNSSEDENTSHVSSSSNQSAISKDFVEHSVKFFDGFLSLCNKHQVLGTATLLQQGTATHEIKAQLRCKLYTIDDEHAEWFFSVAKIGWESAKNKMNDPIDRIHAGETFMKLLYGSDDLHYAFVAIDEYTFGDPDVIVSCDTNLFTMEGAKWEENLRAIKQELSKKWPAAKIEGSKGGLIVKAD